MRPDPSSAPGLAQSRSPAPSAGLLTRSCSGLGRKGVERLKGKTLGSRARQVGLPVLATSRALPVLH